MFCEALKILELWSTEITRAIDWVVMGSLCTEDRPVKWRGHLQRSVAQSCSKIVAEACSCRLHALLQPV